MTATEIGRLPGTTGAPETDGAPRGRAWQVYVVPGAHLDLGWCASIAETLAYGGDLIRRVLDEISGPHPEYRFTIEYALFLKHFLQQYPDRQRDVLRLLDEGRLEVC